MTTTLEPVEVTPGLPELSASGAYRLVADAVQRLSLLGTSERIAEYLIRVGVAGVCGSARRCPIAEWLVRDIGISFTGAFGAPGGVGYNLVAGRISGHRVEVTPAPGPIATFIHDFDNGAYPELERRTERE